MVPKEINQTFVTYYKALYQSEYPRDRQTSFLDKLAIPCISEEAKQELDRVLNLGEISKAIVNMKRGKAAGPDAIPIDVYELFKEKLIAPVLDMYVESLHKELCLCLYHVFK